MKRCLRNAMFILLAATVMLPPVTALATAPVEQKLTGADGAGGDLFGSAVAVDGDTVVVGALLDDNANGTDAGAAYVFVLSGATWSQQAKLLASDGVGGDRFGNSVALDGDVLIVGAYFDDNANGTSAGAAYVFNRSGNTWTEEAKLVASDGLPNHQFAKQVVIDADTVVAGAPGPADSGFTAGAAYVFAGSGASWTEQAKLSPPAPLTDDQFGRHVGIRLDTAVVGAEHDDTSGSNAGAAYIFSRSGTAWSLDAKLLAGDGATDDQFGTVAVDGGTVLVGSYADDNANGTNAGAVYVFAGSGATWSEQAKLLASDGSSEDRFGRNGVALSGGAALVGAFQHDTNGADAGAAYLFARTGSSWMESQKLLPVDVGSEDRFGYATAIDRSTLAVGAYGDDDLGTDAGAVYVYYPPAVVGGFAAGDVNPLSDEHVATGMPQLGLAGKVAALTALLVAAGVAMWVRR